MAKQGYAPWTEEVEEPTPLENLSTKQMQKAAEALASLYLEKKRPSGSANQTTSQPME